MIFVVDYRTGNLNSIVNMLKRSGHQAKLTSDPDEIRTATKLVLPGVGAFDSGMENIAQMGLYDVLSEKVLAAGTPILGICLGMQLLFEGSEEGVRPGFGWMKGRCVRFRFDDTQRALRLKIPHMGWNDVGPTRQDTLFKERDDDAGYYFVHSYHVVCDDERDVLGRTTHGYAFTSAVQREHIFGTQFHPEKSHKHGMRVLKAFAEL